MIKKLDNDILSMLIAVEKEQLAIEISISELFDYDANKSGESAYQLKWQAFGSENAALDAVVMARESYVKCIYRRDSLLKVARDLLEI
jgi:hypothetical protein